MAYEDILNQILNFVAPVAVFGFLGWILYKAFRVPLSGLGEKINEWTSGLKKDKSISTKSINYE